jgi:fatty-acyl-CoA synthase
LADAELQHCLTLVEPSLIIAAPDYLDTLARLDLPELPVISIGPDYEARLTVSPTTDPGVPVDGEDGFVILYTSGTTGMPKGALISHRAMIARSLCIAAEMDLPREDWFIAWAPYFHMASTDQGTASLLRGTPVVIVDGYDPKAIIETLEQRRVGWLLLIPGMIEDFVQALRAAKPIIKGVSMCGAMADLVPPHQLAAVTELLDAPYVNTFGATETGLPPATGSLIPVGVAPTDLAKRQSGFCEIRLVDEDDNEVGTGEPGEVAVRGPTVFSGYWQAPETNAKDFRGGWFHMGDVMARREDGLLTFMDRVKYMIKSGGENIYPAEIERVLLADPRVDDAAVVRKQDARWGEVPVAAIAANAEFPAEELRATCREALAGYKQPKEIRFVAYDDLPRSTTGKIQRHEVEKWFAE